MPTAFDFDNAPPELIEKLAALDLIDKAATWDGVESVAAFGEYVFGKRPAKHHRAWLSEALENNRVAIVAPPESAKSTWMSVILPAWWIGRHPESTNLLVSVSDDQAQKNAGLIADTIEQNPRWKQVFPKVVPDKEKGWSRDGYYVKEDGDYGQWTVKVADRAHPTLSAGGVGSSLIIGKRVSGICVCDDLHDDMSRRSAAVRDNTREFLKMTVSSRVLEDAKLIVVGTRWHPEDVFDHIKTVGLYSMFEHPAISDGVSYWPRRWSLERLGQKRQELGSLDFELMYLCNPAAAQGRLLKREWLRYMSAGDIKRDWPCVFGIDPAFKKQHLIATHTRKRSRFALVKYRIAPGKLVIEDIIADYLTEPEAEALVEREAALDSPVQIRVESNGVGDPFYQTLAARTRLPLTYENARLDTVGRAQLMARDFEYGKVWVSDAATPGLRLFATEWVSLGEEGASDDTISAAYYGWRAAAYAIPRETPEEADKRKARPATISPFKQIEAYYGVGRR